MLELIADNKLPFDSINFKKICTQIRIFLPNDKIKYINKKGSQITIQLPERDLKISKTEYDYYQNYINNNFILRRNFGLEKENLSGENVNNFSNLQLIPIITMPMMNLQLQELIKKGSQGFILINKFDENLQGNRENNVKMEGDEFGDYLSNDLLLNQIPPQNSQRFTNSYFVFNNDDNSCNIRQ